MTTPPVPELPAQRPPVTPPAAPPAAPWSTPAASGAPLPWAGAASRPAGERTTARRRQTVDSLPDWAPLPPGETLVRRGGPRP
ncbi:hypothetical protein ACGILS_26615 [Streptomyces albidoflavus]|uniref:Uncharacterized protein n=3 Tax=Streptomyces TaxID=1883 RepID=A0A126Y8X2_9ACTN|nr:MULTISPECIES: hypothetical protein [Streptomyces]MYQ73753.1 hypothetical protein [Streptomyces sp. SID4934]MYW60718.1 hypothetical protein [Streptomyces sp. SID8370]MYW84494.1 hypothetical protein [Streptomyces sp. SID8371]MYX54160.1 hypothetical protein [Streptomyces sp. SID8385]PKA36608.1 hypothetical protein SM8_021655 [Streptomyces sp. SM8]BDH53191.1 hypothetical protein MTP02_42020 [Streptomyces albus]